MPCFRIVWKTARLKKCMAPSTSNTTPTLVLSVSNRFLRIGRRHSVFQRQGNEPHVDKVKPDHEQVVRIGKSAVPVKTVEKKDAAVAVEGPRDPHRERDADCSKRSGSKP
jgi:hypothetical protein